MTESHSLRHNSARRFDAVLASEGLPGRVVELPESTRTATEAARAVGCELGQIVKSLVFQTTETTRPILVLVSGKNRADEAMLSNFVGEPLARADPEFVRSVTGYAIGGVPPVGLTTAIPTYVDYDLLELSELWAAAGHPHAVCRLTPRELLDLTNGSPVPVYPLPLSAAHKAAWVTFDCYGTLIDWQRGLLEQLDQLAPTRADPARLFSAYLREEKALEAGPYMPYRQLMAEAVRYAARSEGFDVSSEAAKAVPDSIRGWPPFGDTRDSLSALASEGYRIGVLSNIDNDLLALTLQNLDLEADCVVTAEDVRSYKPAFNHWIRFLKQTGQRPDGVLHVSGSVEYDIDSSRRLGFRTAYVARYGDAAAGSAVGFSVRDLRELVRRLRREPKESADPRHSK